MKEVIARLAALLMLFSMLPLVALAQDDSESWGCWLFGWMVRPIGWCEVQEVEVTIVTHDRDVVEEDKPEVIRELVFEYSTTTQPIYQDVTNEYVTIEQTGVSEQILNKRIAEVLMYIDSVLYGVSDASGAREMTVLKVKNQDPIESVTQLGSGSDGMYEYITKEYVVKSLDKVYERISDIDTGGGGGGGGSSFDPDTITDLTNLDLLGTTYVAGSLGIGTTSPSDVLAVAGAVYLAETTPGNPANRLYNLGGDLYWNGVIVNASTSANWAAASGNVYRLTGNVGVGTSTPTYSLTVDGDVQITGSIVDNNESSGTNGSVLQSTGSGFAWVATSSLGFSGAGDDLSDNSITDLSDVDTTGAIVSNILSYNGSQWVVVSSSTFLMENEADSETELESLLADVTNVFTNNDGALSDDDLSDNTISNLSDVNTAGAVVSNILSYNGSEWVVVSSSTFLMENEADSESELESLLSDVTNVFTNNDGALSDDDLSNDSIEALSDVATITETLGDLFYWNGTAWADIATSALNIALSDTTGTLSVTRGGTGLTSITENYLLLGGAGNTFSEVSTSSLGFRESLFTDAGSYTYLTSVNDDLQVGTSSISSGARLSIQASSTNDILSLFNTNGTEVFTVRGDGEIGVYDSSPSFGIEIATTSAFGYLGISNAGTGNIFVVDENGDVGIGINNPKDKLHISSGNLLLENAQTIRWENNSGNPNTIMAYNSSNILEIGSGIGGALELYGNNNLLFHIGGEEIARFNSAGNYGLYDAGPDYRFEIASTSAIGYFGITNATDGDIFAINTSGNVGIGTSTPTSKLSVAGVITPDADNTYSLGNATYRWSVVYAADGTINTSDERLKDNITNLRYGLDEILELDPVSFTWKDNQDGVTRFGLIAQDVEDILPEIVVTGDDADKTKGIRYTELTAVVIEAIQEMWDTVTGNTDRIEKLEDRIYELERNLEIQTNRSVSESQTPSESEVEEEVEEDEVIDEPSVEANDEVSEEEDVTNQEEEGGDEETEKISTETPIDDADEPASEEESMEEDPQTEPEPEVEVEAAETVE